MSVVNRNVFGAFLLTVVTAVAVPFGILVVSNPPNPEFQKNFESNRSLLTVPQVESGLNPVVESFGSNYDSVIVVDEVVVRGDRVVRAPKSKEIDHVVEVETSRCQVQQLTQGVGTVRFCE